MKNTIGEGNAGDEKIAERMTRESWIAAAVVTLTSESIDQVKIQVIAKALGVSRSSFYWFFTDLKDLHHELLQHWLRKNTDPIIDRATRPARTVTEAVCNVFECWIDPALFDPRLDAAIRFWGQVDADIHAIVDHADDRRVQAIAEMFSRFDYPQNEAFIRARVLYFTQVGHFMLGIREDRETRLSYLRSYLLSFTGRPPLDDEVNTFSALMRRLQPA